MYCLLGIFDINMPLLYGEGKKAFLRLQQEIMARSQDCSFLLWTAPATTYYHLAYGNPATTESFSVLVHEPSYFDADGMATSDLDFVREIGPLASEISATSSSGRLGYSVVLLRCFLSFHLMATSLLCLLDTRSAF
jgi:hypothetical protein